MPSKTNTPPLVITSSSLSGSFPAPGSPQALQAQTFDILPKLHLLLSRLIPQVTDPTSNNATTSATTPTYQKLDALSLKDLETEASAIKVQIQKAKAAAEVLPDMERGLVEQEIEIKELEERVRELKSILSGS